MTTPLSFRARWLVPLLALGGGLACNAAGAQEAGVRTSLGEHDTVWVGQEVDLVVELLAPGYFASAVNFDLPDPEGVLLIPSAGHPVMGNETIDGTQYTVQRHRLRAWPMRDGDQAIPALTARFSFKRNPLDTDEVPASVTTDPIPFSVQRPPGSENLGTVISARNLEIDDSWSPEPGADAVKAGAAFTRTVSFTAPDVPGMVFPPFPAGQVDGLGIYPKRQLLDQDQRGSLTGVRHDEITYVCQRPGQFTVPAVQFTWFDLDSKQLRTKEFPARTLNVVANPAMASATASRGADAAGDPRVWGKVAGGVALLLLALVAARRPGVRQFFVNLVAPLRPVHLQPLNPAGRETHRRARRTGHGRRTPQPLSS